jgi:hypothetical protein
MNSVRYQYVSTRRRRHPVTVAYVAAESSDQITITLGASFCHEADRFSRHLGREIAEGRLSRSPFRFTIPFDREQTPAFGKAVADSLRHFVESHEHKISTAYSRKD